VTQALPCGLEGQLKELLAKLSSSSVPDAAGAIAGYVLVNDVSERAFQIERGGQWSKGKSAETFNPTGPWLATPDEIDENRKYKVENKKNNN